MTMKDIFSLTDLDPVDKAKLVTLSEHSRGHVTNTI